MPDRPQQLSLGARVYIALVMGAGVWAVVASALDLAQRPFQPEWLLLAALTLLTGSFSIKIPSVNARLSVSETFVFAAALLFGPSPATMIVALDTMILSSWFRRASRSRLRALFNVSAGTTAIWISAHLFKALLPETPAEPRLEELLVPVLALAASYFTINSALVAVAVGLEGATSPIAVWRQSFAWIGLNYLGGASVAMLLVSYGRRIDLAALGVIVPLLIITYLTFRTSLGRLADAHRHIEQVNELYLSTIETLAMAVDAKDQITHGHIRRVQVYATELARRLGVTEESQIRAIEAAALLHDMGKLAIPEHILNKPGKLTPAEFETMKRHASIGADLLSEIKFPYPVVPIVRHHHENWNGGGYPTGISGPDIPLGARILSVVDCFDALNSDRPYRPKMTIDESFAILRERSGTMYDPLVVETFISAFPEIAEPASRAGQQARSLTLQHGVQDSPKRSALNEIRNAAADSTILTVARRDILGQSSPGAALEEVGRQVRFLTPSVACAYFRYQPEADELVCAFVSEEPYRHLLGQTIRRGERVSGWVAANLQTIGNSDAALDLGESAPRIAPTPQGILSTPILAPGTDSVWGVLTAYSPLAGAYSSQHIYAFEQLGDALAAALSELHTDPAHVAVAQAR